MAVLVTLNQFKDAQRITTYVEDADLQLRLNTAEEMVLSYVTQRVGTDASLAWATEVTAWTSSTAPMRVKAAILAMAGYLYRWRGDDAEDERPKLGPGELPPDVVMCLYRLRDPALA